MSCRVIILYTNALFGHGLRSLLTRHGGFEVPLVTVKDAGLAAGVRTHRPEVVIVEESDAAIQSPTLGAILQRHPAGRVVALDLNHNFATVYDRRRVVTNQPADLVRAIRGGPRGRGNLGENGLRRRCVLRNSPAWLPALIQGNACLPE